MAASPTTFGDYLRTLRKARAMSQNELAERAGINDKYLGEVERGYGNPSLDVLQKLAKALKIDLATLVGDEVTHMDRQGLSDELARQQSGMTDDQLRDLVRMLRFRAK